MMEHGSTFFGVRFEMEDLLASFAEAERRGLDISPALKKFGRIKRKEVAETIAEAKGMVPLSPATIERYARDMGGKDKFTMKGELRQNYAQQLERERRKLQGLKAWAEKTYGKKWILWGHTIPTSIQKKFDRFDQKIKRLEAQVEKRKEHSVTQLGQVGSAQQLAQEEHVEVRIVADGSRKRARIASPGYNGAANVKFPRHLRGRVGASYMVPVSAVRMTSAGYYSVKPTRVLRGSAGAAGGGSYKILGKVPQTLYWRVLQQGRAFALVWGSRWRKDGIHNEGDEHTPQRKHVDLTQDDIQRVMQILISYGLKPLRGGRSG